ncbi:MAG TPA: zf-HC2 domain-containing protein [Myxococcaceae bacterium]|nr:zf-HC2 domain-containing protein [Myxococcaceae bacterium]
MACEERWMEILSAWQDGEATVAEIAQVRAHLSGCARCQDSRESFQWIHQAFGGLRVEAGPASVPAPRPRPALDSRWHRRWPALTAGALAVAAVLTLVWAPLHQHGSGLVDELEARHLTAFARASPCEFTSSDPTAVRAWVASNLGYDIEVPTVPHATLLGARRCTVHGGMTASLLYRRGDEALSLFLPRAGTTIDSETARMSRARSGCTVGRLGAVVCARPGLFAVAETEGTALAALESF